MHRHQHRQCDSFHSRFNLEGISTSILSEHFALLRQDAWLDLWCTWDYVLLNGGTPSFTYPKTLLAVLHA